MAKALEESNVSGELACPNCRSAFATPKMLQCSHFFCPECIKGMSLSVSAESSHKYECIICSSTTTSDQLRELPFVSDLLNVADLEQSKKSSCVSCDKRGPLQRCLDCKDNFCDTCRIERHDNIPLLKKHSWEGITDTKQCTIDRIEYCIVHPMKELRMYCCECAVLVCDECILGKHGNHRLSSGQKQVLKSTANFEDSLKVIAEEHANALKRVISLAENLKKSYEDMELQIKRVTEDVIKKIREEASTAKTNLTKIRETHLTEVSHTELSLERKVQSQENVLHLTQRIKSAAENMSRLHFLQTIKPCLESHLKDKIDIDFTRDFSARAKLFITENPTAVGISPLTNRKCSHFSEPLNDLATMRFVLEREVKLGYLCYRFLPIPERDEIWCVQQMSDKIHVYCFEGKNLKVVQIKGYGNIQSLAWDGKHILVATRTELFQANVNGQVLCKIVDGVIIHISMFDDVLYALDNSNNMVKVFKLTQGSDKYRLSSEIILSDYHRSDSNTIQATEEYVFVAECQIANVQLYKTASGSFVRNYNNTVHQCPWLSHPRMSGAGVHGQVLVACYDYNVTAGLYVLSSDGKHKRIAIDNLNYPNCAFLHQDKFFLLDVYHGFLSEGTLKIFSVL